MKKTFLFFIAAAVLLLTSCSGDDDSGSSSQTIASMKVDGVLKTFNTVTVNEDIVNDKTIKTFTISDNGSPTEMFTFQIESESLGDQMDYFAYFGTPYFSNANSNVTVNSDNTIKATLQDSFMSQINHISQ